MWVEENLLKQAAVEVNAVIRGMGLQGTDGAR